MVKNADVSVQKRLSTLYSHQYGTAELLAASIEAFPCSRSRETSDYLAAKSPNSHESGYISIPPACSITWQKGLEGTPRFAIFGVRVALTPATQPVVVMTARTSCSLVTLAAVARLTLVAKTTD